ncbi:unnamed protein product [Sphagnum balticum]
MIPEFDLVKYELHNKTVRDADKVQVYSVGLTIVFRRKPSFYTLIFVIPSAIVTAVGLIGTNLHRYKSSTQACSRPTTNEQERGEKCTLGSASLLAMTIILTMVGDHMPKEEALNLPILGRFALAEIMLCATGTFAAVMIMLLHSKEAYDEPVPAWLLQCTCLSGAYSALSTHEDTPVHTHQKSAHSDDEKVEKCRLF